jgi:hypothetical protein
VRIVSVFHDKFLLCLLYRLMEGQYCRFQKMFSCNVLLFQKQDKEN